LQWLFFEQYSHEPNIATSRFIVKYLDSPPDRQTALEEKRIAGYKALDVMEAELESKEFFVDAKYSLADIALYAYTHVAADGGFDLKAYPKVRAWLGRVEATPAYVPMRSK
jgi:glutathione S-transferase